ncbi:hypothetical protein HF086_005664 [Spodoptera exigua]|uniref:Uncharacterized protein n=1 Tax=Spodoptera exigua TaxID=7107 RepID=A0A922MYB2_SPOEX|nr:hypothetical protein HF086_005664 [Spodoptera exigua]
MYCDWPTLGRCCFCMPLRRGILTFGYINLIFSAFMVGVYSYSVHTEFAIQIYLIILIRSLLKKMEQSNPHGYENQLQQIVYEGKVESNGVYDPTVVPVDV